MENFSLLHARDPREAMQAATHDRAAYIAGGTDLMQLMRANVEAPSALVDLARLDMQTISADQNGLRLGALVTMAAAAAHPGVRRDYTMISEALLLSASPQVRNMGTMGGNPHASPHFG